jgi:hypothetical protein
MSGWPLPKSHAVLPFPPRDEGEVSSANRRRFTRIPCPPDASVRLRAGTSARLLDVGLGGALVESPSRIVLGPVYATMFVTPEVAFRAQARIVRAYVAGVTQVEGGTSLLYRAGLEFGMLSPTEAGTLGTFVSNALGTKPIVVAPPAAPDRSVYIQFPQAWSVSRKNSTIVARAPNSPSHLFLGAPQGLVGRDLGEQARASMLEAGFSALHGQAAEINGLPAWVGFYNGRLNDLGVVIVEAAHVVLNHHTYVIAGVAPWDAYETVRHEFFTTINSFGGPKADGACVVSAPSPRSAEVLDFAAALPAGSR